MALVFPENRTDYQGTLRLTPDDEEQIELFLPASFQVGDKVEYGNVGIGAAFAGMSNLATATAEEFAGFSKSYDNFLGTGENTRGTVGALGVQKAVALFGDKAVAAASDASRIAPNPNTRAIFKQVNLRSFQFTFKMIPNSASEALNIKEIIAAFRRNLYPTSQGVIAYEFPKRFDIEAFYNGVALGIQFKPCYLESLITNYNPSSQAFMKSSAGQAAYFAETDLSLTFMEAVTLDRQSVEAGF